MTTNASILIVDDEPNNFDVIEGFLQPEAYELHYAPTGADALEFLEDFEPDIILLDVMMPGMNGMEFSQHIRAHPRWSMVPIIMITALTSKQDLAACLAAGADDFIGKPVNRLELIARIKSLLRIRQQYYQLKAFSKLQRDTINFLGKNARIVSSQFSSGLSQKISNPLQQILQHLEHLTQNLNHLEQDEILQHLHAAEQSVYHLQNLNRKFLVYTQLEVLEENMVPASVNTISKLEVIRVLQQIAAYYKRPEDLSIDLQSTEIAIDKDYILVVLQELCDNAFKFSSPGTSVKVTSFRDDNQICFCVEDQGVAFEQHQVANIQRYFRMTRHMFEQKGIGLGFSIICKIATLANGTLEIEECPHGGKKVLLCLPLS